MTLAGYVYTPKTVTNHLHLGVAPAVGGSPSGMGAHGEPPYLISHVQKRFPIFSSLSSFNRSLDGSPHGHVLKDVSGVPVIFQDMRYEVRVSPETFDLLKNLLKRDVLLIDNIHCADDQNHAPFIRVMRFDEMQYDSNLEPMLIHQVVNLTFLDMQTVSRP
jgi:hypothetical protein